MKTTNIHGMECRIGVPIASASISRKTRAFIEAEYPDANVVYELLSAKELVVTARDIRKSEPKSYNNCAIARAAIRSFGCKDAVVTISNCVLIFDDCAVKSAIGDALKLIIKANDDGEKERILEGGYRLSAVCPSHTKAVVKRKQHVAGGVGRVKSRRIKRKRAKSVIPLSPFPKIRREADMELLAA